MDKRTSSSPVREIEGKRERERDNEREKEREKEMGMTGALAPFSYPV
jgi:hypothetical protein